MNNFTSRGVFAALCAVGFFVIVLGAWWEIARVRSDSDAPLSHQLKLRLFSAALWMTIFAAFFCAVVWLWPTAAPHTPLLKSQAGTFLMAIGATVVLMLIALILLLLDLMQTSRARREQWQQRQQNMTSLLQQVAQAKAAQTQTEELQNQESSTRNLENLKNDDS